MCDRAGASNKIRYPGELELFGKGRLLLLDSEVGSNASFGPRAGGNGVRIAMTSSS